MLENIIFENIKIIWQPRGTIEGAQYSNVEVMGSSHVVAYKNINKCKNC